MTVRVNNYRVESMKRIISPKELWEKHPVDDEMLAFVGCATTTIENILEGKDKRLLVIVGPCSITDTECALEYARRLKALAKKAHKEIFPVLRVCFQKPRTGTGWPGLSNDPRLDGSYKLSEGYELSWKIAREITKIGIPIATEPVDTYFIHYISKLVSYVWIGARTASSSEHRRMASALSMPVGFKNSEGGSTQVAVDAAYTTKFPHTFPGIDDEGFPCEIRGKGNSYSHIILRGGKESAGVKGEPRFLPNYDQFSVSSAIACLTQKGLRQKLIIDCSHGNSEKDYKKQESVFAEVLEQIIKRRLSGNDVIAGVMLESHLTEGRQSTPDNPADILHDKSVTDSCMGWDTTKLLLEETCRRLSMPCGKEKEKKSTLSKIKVPSG